MPSDVCNNLLCGSCEIAKATRRRPGINSKSPTYKSLRAPDILPGDCINCYHYGSPIKGRSVSSSGHSSTRHGFEGGCIFVDNASGWMYHKAQRTLSASDTISMLA
jgi:hypothetical protein